MIKSLNFMTAEDAASYINNGDVVGFSGFTAAGAPKAVPQALARRARNLHENGQPFKISIYTGASTGFSLDSELANADAIAFRTPYQSSKDLREGINAGRIPYVDMHLSHLAQQLRYGFLPKPKFAIIEACDVTEYGEIVPTTGVGISPTICQMADHIIIELNHNHPTDLRGFHDIYIPADPPQRLDIPIYKVSDRLGALSIQVNPEKILGIVETNRQDEVSAFAPQDAVTDKIGENVAEFLVTEIKAGRIPKQFLPIQSGVGNIANAVLGALGSNPHIPPFDMFTEVIQDAVIGLMENEKVKFASGCSLTITPEQLQKVYLNKNFFRNRIGLRSQEVTNNPEVIRRLGLITINTALEADIYGNVNSTHVLGTKMMNGIGGSGDFTRNAYLSIFTAPSTAKNGAISAIVPMVSHHDHTEHDVHIIITEHGVADLRGKAPVQRAMEVIDNCVDPSYRDLLKEYFALGKGHTPHDLNNCFAFHREFLKSGDMHNVTWR
ncbi:MAG: acetyl-CoA hydrolase/transferase family protein [Tannerella sp.]|jgi:succinate CoA transferase|nr:acetyl-CoA hydrolase/transferase family protein [Tannerella sp.]